MREDMFPDSSTMLSLEAKSRKLMHFFDPNDQQYTMHLEPADIIRVDNILEYEFYSTCAQNRAKR